MIRIEPIKHFICQKVLPVTYDNSLSYYEVLCKFVHSLNDVISNINGLVADYEALYNFVINYFDNLDIEEEVQKQIEEMLDSPEFAQYLLSIIGFVTPTMFGAKGDGETDDSQAYDNCFATGFDVKIFPGTYNIPNSILSVDHQKVECLGDVELLTSNPVYFYTGRWMGGEIHATDCTGVVLTNGDNEIDGLKLTVTVNGGTEEIERLKKNGISCQQGTGIIKNSKIYGDGCYMGIWADYNDGVNNHYVLQIHNNYITNCYRNGIFTSAKCCDIAYNILDHNHLAEVPGGGQMDIVGKSTQGYTTVRNNIIQNGANQVTSGVEMEYSANVEIFDNVIDVSTTMLYGIVLQGASHAHIHDNTIIGGTSQNKRGTAISSEPQHDDAFANIITTRNNWMFNCLHNFHNGNQTSIVSLDEHRYSGDLIYNNASHLPIIDVNNGYMWTGTLAENEGCNFYVRDVHHMKFVVERTVHIDGQPDRYIGDVMVDANNGFVVVTSQSSDFSYADHILTYGNNTLGQPVNVYVMTVN